MSKNQIVFFSTKADLVSLLDAVESRRELQYIRTGVFKQPQVEPLYSMLAVHNLGRMDTGDANHAPSYLVASRDSTIQVRPVAQRGGEVTFAVDQSINPATIIIRPGGSFGNNCLIAGQIGTTSENPDSIALLWLFTKEIQQRYCKIKSFYVGQAACECLDQGWRLTSNAKSPQQYDLARS